MKQGIIEAYRSWLPVTKKTPVVSLHEGNTPLLYAKNLSAYLKGNLEVFLKYEGLNPTGSFKDRGMTMAISKGLEAGAQAVICASTGNTSASASAYTARCGIKCFVLLPKGGIAMGKLAQALIHGAIVFAVKGTFDQALELVKGATEKASMLVVNSINPFRLEGQKTAAFEICDQLGEAPEYHAIPVGNAGNITAYWQGYKEYYAKKRVTQKPIMLGFQAAGAAPIVENRIIKKPKTIASAIQIGNPANWKSALTVMDESKGQISAVTDKEILEAYQLVARLEGVFAEPASAASIAGIKKLADKGFFKGKKAKVVCTLTGHGLKDADRAIQTVKQPIEIEPDLDQLLEKINKVC